MTSRFHGALCIVLSSCWSNLGLTSILMQTISMERILDRYERSSYAGQEIPTLNLDSQGACPTECSKLLRMIDVIQTSVRHLKGEEVDALSIRELPALEMQLDTALKKIRSRKNQLMMESVAQLQKKEKELKELKKQLTKKAHQREAFELQNLRHDLATPRSPLSFGDTSQRNGVEEEAAGIIIRSTNITLPHWMPRLTGD